LTSCCGVTVTLNVAVACRPLLAIATQLTVVVVIGNTTPDSGVQLKELIVVPGAGVAVALYITTAPLELVAAVVMSAGTVIVGGAATTSGVTVTLNVALDFKPALFVAEHVTVVVVIANVDPEAGAHVTVSVPSAKSVAVGFVNVTTAPVEPVAAFVIFAGRPVIVGAVSVTVTLNVAVASFVLLATAVQETVVVVIANVDPEAGVHANEVIVVPDAGVAVAV
jgi:hypothetical protein